ncbi:MAG: hypothetical protein PCFJNLEI_02743 [Verrucomicrobiae bacterium]|nr:hypothetical protein [Verrucomicrobiae bacterium]
MIRHCLQLGLLLLVPALAAETDEHRFATLAAAITATNGPARALACSNLYEFVQEAIRLAENTPGKEAANFLRTGHLSNAVARLGQGQLPRASTLYSIHQLTRLAYRGLTWPKPPALDVPHAGNPPVIDGRLNDVAWAKALVLTNSYRFNETNPAPVQTTYRLLWDTNNLYFAFDCVDEDVVAPTVPRDSAEVYRNDSVEMFILPDRRARRYWEIAISPATGIFDSLQLKHQNEWSAAMEPTANIAGLQIGVVVHGTLNDSSDRDAGYTVEVAVPFNQLPGHTNGVPVPGQTFSIMLARMNRTTRNSDFQPYAFIPLLSWGHNLWNHSQITLRR